MPSDRTPSTTADTSLVANLTSLGSLDISRVAISDVRDRLEALSWDVTEYNPDHAYLWAAMTGRPPLCACLGRDQCSRFPGRAFLWWPLYYDDGSEPEEEFDREYERACGVMEAAFGSADERSPRNGNRCGHAVWRRGGAFIILVQDDYDIQCGLDVSLWVVEAVPGDSIPTFPLAS
jgi:hypothetical protein